MTRLRKWLKRGLIGILLLAVVLLAGMWALLRTNIPRDIVLQQARMQLGVAIEADTLQIGWTGRSRLTDLTLRLPLEDKPLLSVPELRLRHNALWHVLGTASFQLDRIEIDQPTIRLTQDADGQWNLANLLQRLPTTDQPPSAWGINWPAVAVNDATVHVAPLGREPITIEPINITTEAQRGVAYFMDASIGEQLTASGHIKAGPRFEHDAALHLQPNSELLAAVLQRDTPLPLEAELAWRGHRTEAGLRGRVNLKRIALGPRQLSGALGVHLAGPTLTVTPEALAARFDNRPLTVTLDQGRVQFADGQLDLTGLRLAAEQPTGGHYMTLDGGINLAEATAQLNGQWSGSIETSGTTHTGEVELTATRPTADRLAGQARVTSTGRTDPGSWNLATTLEANARGTDHLDLTATLARLTWTNQAGRTLGLTDLTARAERRGDQWTLTELTSAADGQLSAQGRYNQANGTWQFAANATDWAAEQIGRALTANVEAEGRGPVAHLKTGEITFADIQANFTGDYDPRAGQPLNLETTINTRLADLLAFTGDGSSKPDNASTAAPADAPAAEPPDEPDAPTAAEPATENAAPAPNPDPNDAETSTTASADASPAWAGDLKWTGRLTGSIQPLNLTAAGDLTAEQLHLNGRAIDSLQWPLIARLDDDQIALTGERIDLFDGEARFTGELQRAANRLDVDLRLNNIELARLMRLVSDNLAATGRGTLDLQLALPLDDPAGTQVKGDFQIEKADIEGLAADRLSGQLRTRGPVLRLDPLTLDRADGRAVGSATLNLRDTRHLRANLQLTDWPLNVPAAATAFTFNGSTRLRYDTQTNNLRGRLDANARIACFNQPAGELRVRGGFENQRLQLPRIEGDLFGGRIQGQLDIPLGDWTASRGELTWNELDLQRLPDPWNPAPLAAEGVIATKLAFAPTDAPRAPGPLKIEWTLAGRDIKLRRMPIQQARVIAYAKRGRVVIQQGAMHLADGHIDGWASARQRDGRWFTNLQLGLNDLDLARIKHAIDNDTEGDRLIGRLAGRARATGFLGQWPNLIRADLQLTDSDLVGNNIVSGIFALAGVSLGQTEPSGEGEIALRMEHRTLFIERFDYFNRGTDLYGRLTIEDVARGGSSRITGFAVAAQRLLKGVPFLTQADEILAAFQSAAATVSIGGTLGQPAVTSARLDQISEPLRALLQRTDAPD